MNLIDRQHGALVLVDYQQRLMPAIHRGAEAVAHASRLADIAHVLGLPVIGTEQNPQGLGPNVPAIRERCDTTLPRCISTVAPTAWSSGCARPAAAATARSATSSSLAARRMCA